MKRRFVIQNGINKSYWYGNYTNKQWTDNILEARLFDDKRELQDWIKNNYEVINGMFLVVIEVCV